MRQSIVALAERRQHGQHPGLILQRYLRCPAIGTEDAPAERRALFHDAIRAGQSDGLRAVYADAFRRWNASFPAGDLLRSAEFHSEGRLIVGLGSENVLETGIRLHHTYGVPIIPGSALKGLASHYCHDVWGQGHLADAAPEENKPFRRNGQFHNLLFGSTKDGGVIVFHDAWITPESLAQGALVLDVMTPHHPDWQSESSPKPPTDFDSPVPVSFLSVAGNFQVRVSWGGPRDTAPEIAKEWTARAFELVQAALVEWGIGGKTSSGYGRLVSDEQPTASQSSPASKLAPVHTPQPVPVPKRQLGSKVKVKVLEPHGTIKSSFFVQEADQPKRGLLTGIKQPPDGPAPEIGSEIEVYINSLGPPPQYRWDKPTTTTPSQSQRGPGSRPPRGRR